MHLRRHCLHPSSFRSGHQGVCHVQLSPLSLWVSCAALPWWLCTLLSGPWGVATSLYLNCCTMPQLQAVRQAKPFPDVDANVLPHIFYIGHEQSCILTRATLALASDQIAGTIVSASLAHGILPVISDSSYRGNWHGILTVIILTIHGILTDHTGDSDKIWWIIQNVEDTDKSILK